MRPRLSSRVKGSACQRPLILWAAAIVQAAIVLGPALGPGLVIRYDMAWSSDPSLTPFVLGLDTPAPRAVPSDAVAVLVGKVIGASLAQKSMLFGILIALALGAAALLRELTRSSGLSAQIAAVVAAVWNPFVHERLLVGQWTVLAGLALLPWALRESLRTARGVGNVPVLALVVALAGLGGANTLVVVLAALVPALMVTVVARRDRTSWSGLLATTVVALGVSAAWSLPALAAGARSAVSAVDAFAPVADSPLGVLGSLAGGGGFWNSAVHPEARQLVPVALTAALLAIIGVGAAWRAAAPALRGPLTAAVAIPTLAVLVSVFGPLESLWQFLVTGVPGGGLLRDSHKFLAPWVLVGAVGLGCVVTALSSHKRRSLAGPAAVLIIGLPVALSSSLAWGGLGSLEAVRVPQDYRDAARVLDSAPEGDVGLLPWNQYRRYAWNDDRISLTLAPRMIDRVVVFDDSLPLSSGVVPGESPRAERVLQATSRGESSVAALTAEGVRYLVLERTVAGRELETEVRGSGRLLLENSQVMVVDLGEGRASSSKEADHPLTRIGWSITLGTMLVVVGVVAVRRRRTPKW